MHAAELKAAGLNSREAVRSIRAALRKSGATEDPGVQTVHGTSDLQELMLGALEGRLEIPDSVLNDPQLKSLAESIEQRMFSAALKELSSLPEGASLQDVLPLFESFARVRARFVEPTRAPSPSDTVALRWETIELVHDFRSPLTSILFLADTLRRGLSGPVSELQHKQLGIICSAALGIVSLANDVIGLAHGGEQLMDRKPSAFSLRELLESTVEVVQPIAEGRNISLRLLVQATDRCIGHSAMLSRILLNLTTNALKYTDAGMVELIARGTGEGRVELSVRDTGRGLDQDTIDNLYQPFRCREGGARRSLDSYGLGLTICRKLVHALGSELHYETSPGWGTRFFFELSLPPAPAE